MDDETEAPLDDLEAETDASDEDLGDAARSKDVYCGQVNSSI